MSQRQCVKGLIFINVLLLLFVFEWWHECGFKFLCADKCFPFLKNMKPNQDNAFIIILLFADDNIQPLC